MFKQSFNIPHTPDLGRGAFTGHGRPLPMGRLPGSTKKRQFTNNLHHSNHMPIFGYSPNGLKSKQQIEFPNDEGLNRDDHHYWSSYRLSYEQMLKRKMELNREKMR